VSLELSTADVRLIVTPDRAVVIELLVLVAAVPLIENSASAADVFWVHAMLPAEVTDDRPPESLPAVDVTPRLDIPLSPDTLVTLTLMTFDAPVAVELSTR